MAMPPQMAPSQSPSPQGPAQSMPPQGAPQASEGQQEGDPKEAALTNMIISTDQALTKITQVIGQTSPEAGKALAQVNEQFRTILQSVMSQEDKGEAQGPGAAPSPQAPPSRGKRPAPQMAPQVSGGSRAVTPAY